MLSSDLESVDPELYSLVQQEKKRQILGLEMIASENFTSYSVLQAQGTCFQNKYSEGYPGERYYGGNEIVDQVETICQQRALKVYGLKDSEWGVNVQPYSGSPANFAAYTALAKPHGRIMGLDLPDGGHLTHGFMTANKRVSATSMFFESMPYKIDPSTELIDYKRLRENAKLFKPKIIIAGVSCYPRHLDYKEFRSIADDNNAYLLGDMSHISGLVAAKCVPSPFDYCDVVTTTSHKTLRGPRAGMIFYRKIMSKDGDGIEIGEKINEAVFPGLQGGPHNNTIAALAVALKIADTPEFQSYGAQVLKNAHVLAKELQDRGYRIVTNGTENHIVWLDLKPSGISGAKAESILEKVSIACNKNTVPGDKSPRNPGGIRLGTAALTTREFKEDEMRKVAGFIDEALKLGKDIQTVSGPKLVDFKLVLSKDEAFKEKIESLKAQVEAFAGQFPFPESVC